MKTLTLIEAAELLHMNAEALRQKEKARIIPAAKPGKCWVFIESDLLAYLRSLYGSSRQTVQGQQLETELGSKKWTPSP